MYRAFYVALVLAGMILLSPFASLAEPPARIEWNASQFMEKAKVTRYLLNGSSIERRYDTLKAAKACNGWVNLPDTVPAKTCALLLDSMEDLAYAYRIREYDRDGREVADRTCHPMRAGWDCKPTVKGGAR